MNENACACTQRHVPLPQKLLSQVVAGEEVFLCPTTYFNVASLLDWYRIFGGDVPGSITKHYSKYVRDLTFALSKETPYNENV
jgi:hypothetical protein